MSYDGFENLPDLAVRQGRWKLLCDFDGSRPQLYDPRRDPGETEMLATAQAEVAEELKKRYPIGTARCRSTPQSRFFVLQISRK